MVVDDALVCEATKVLCPFLYVNSPCPGLNVPSIPRDLRVCLIVGFNIGD